MFQGILTLIGLGIIGFAWSKIDRKKWSERFFKAGSYSLLGLIILLVAQNIKDPSGGWQLVISQEDIAFAISAVTGIIFLFKAAFWAISKTGTFQKIVKKIFEFLKDFIYKQYIFLE